MKEGSTKRGKKENLTKLVLKNSAYNFTTTFISKIGGLVFTIIIARMLLPELFGVYNLALSVILLATAFADLGVGTTCLRYVSKALEKNNRPKARSYFRYLLKLKGLLMLLVIIIILLIAKPLAYNLLERRINPKKSFLKKASGFWNFFGPYTLSFFVIYCTTLFIGKK